MVRDMQFDNTGRTYTAGEVGIMAVFAANSNNFIVKNCKCLTPGSLFVGLNQNHSYGIIDNVVDLISTDGNRHGTDGIIDQWWGCHDFSIKGNIVRGNNVGHYGILTTATLTNGTTASPMYNFEITDNKIWGNKYAGLWVMGRAGTAYNFKLLSNFIYDTIGGGGTYGGMGLAVSDVRDFLVAYNHIARSYHQGILIGKDSGGNSHGSVSNNIIADPSTYSAAMSFTDAAIAVTGSTKIAIGGNIIRGTGHNSAIHLDSTTSYCKGSGNVYDNGSSGGIMDYGTGNSVT